MDVILNHNLVSQQLTSQFHPQHFLAELPFQLKRTAFMLYVFSQMSNISNLTSTLLHLIPLQNLRNNSFLKHMEQNQSYH